VNKINLAVVFDQKIYSGGGYQQSITAALIAKKLPNNLVHVDFYTTEKENLKVLKNFEISAKLIKLGFFSKIRTFLYRKIKDKYIFKIFRFIEKANPREKFFLRDNIDLVYFLSPTSWPLDLENINYITTVWDLCHLDNPEFPEVRVNREFERRENIYEGILKKATAVIVDSKHTLFNITNKYRLDENRVYISPFQSSYGIRNSINNLNYEKIDIKKKFQIKTPYIFYPAQFWSHKNHIYLLKGLKLLEENYGVVVEVIFCGKDNGSLEHVKEQAFEMKLSDRVHILGFVSNFEIFEIYRQATALVMPTYFGPTNIPPLEAFEIGIPVIYSNIKGSKEQLGDAALYIDLKNPLSLANQLMRLLDDKNLKEKLISEGKKKAEYNNSIDRLNILKSIIEDFKNKRDCWK
tara:strand:- start:58 stop:1278 length:1221 start_codon:yes stop_codon:yes gene_type:complete